LTQVKFEYNCSQVITARLDRCTECKLISSAVFYINKCSTQARNQLGTPVGTKSFLRVAYIF